MKDTLIVIAKGILLLLGGWWFGPSEPDTISKMQTQPKRKPQVVCGECSTEVTFETAVCPKCGFRFGRATA
jgi:hypothetical protein